jgi:putative SOS response-associated peptidase YedK
VRARRSSQRTSELRSFGRAEVRDSRLDNYPRRWNACPSQELLVIRQNPKTGERSLDLLKWGLIPYWCKDPKGGRKPINAKSETVAHLPMFRDATGCAGASC